MGLLKKIFGSKTNKSFNEKKYKNDSNKAINNKKAKYDMDSLEGIKAIPVPKKKAAVSKVNEGVVIQLEYILQRKATEHKKNGRMDLAIACLQKSNEIMPLSPFSYSPKDYNRLVEFLKQDGQFDLARKEEEKLNKKFSVRLSNTKQKALSGYDDKQSINYKKCDLVETDSSYFVCEECAKYKKRIFSEFGFNKKYPKLPDYLKGDMCGHEYCSVFIYPFTQDVSVPAWKYKGSLVKHSNRPFVDERTTQQKNDFKAEVKNREDEQQDRLDFDFIREHLLDITPKSFGGYRKMKNTKSKNYLKIVSEAKEKGYLIRE